MTCCDDDVLEHDAETVRTARKVHRCCECGVDRIRPGDRYRETTGMLDREWVTYRTCMRCTRVGEALQAEARQERDRLRKEFPGQPWRWEEVCDCWSFGDLRQVLRSRNQWRRGDAKEADRG